MTGRKSRPLAALPEEAREHVEALARILGEEADIVDDALRRMRKRQDAQRKNASRAGGRPRGEYVDRGVKDVVRNAGTVLFPGQERALDTCARRHAIREAVERTVPADAKGTDSRRDVARKIGEILQEPSKLKGEDMEAAGGIFE